MNRNSLFHTLKQVAEKLGKSPEELSLQYLGKEDRKIIIARPNLKSRIGELPLSDLDIISAKISIPKSIREVQDRNFAAATNKTGEPRVVSRLSQPVNATLYYSESNRSSQTLLSSQKSSSSDVENSVQTCSIEIQTDGRKLVIF